MADGSDTLNEAYGEFRCILTQMLSGNDWCHLISHGTYQVQKVISIMKDLRLISDTFTATSRKNILPMGKGYHADFDASAWTIYPPVETLVMLISQEESPNTSPHQKY